MNRPAGGDNSSVAIQPIFTHSMNAGMFQSSFQLQSKTSSTSSRSESKATFSENIVKKYSNSNDVVSML